MSKLNPYFGQFGGQYMPEILIPALNKLEQTFIETHQNDMFQQQFHDLLQNYDCRPTELTIYRNLIIGAKTKLYLKQKDLLHVSAHKTSQVVGLGFIR